MTPIDVKRLTHLPDNAVIEHSAEIDATLVFEKVGHGAYAVCKSTAGTAQIFVNDRVESAATLVCLGINGVIRLSDIGLGVTVRFSCSTATLIVDGTYPPDLRLESRPGTIWRKYPRGLEIHTDH